MKFIAVCEQCARWHPIEFDPLKGYGNAVIDWYVKHEGHENVKITWPTRSLKKRLKHGQQVQVNDLLSNADIKTAYASSAAYTITLGALATSSTLVAGRESTAISNTSNLYLDYLVGGKIQVGTTPTVSTTIEVWAYASSADAPTYPDVFDGTDSAETVTSAAIKMSALRLLASMACDATTSNRDYPFAATSLAAAHGGCVPKYHGLFVTHSTAVNLNSTDGNHVISYTPVYLTSA